MHDFFEDYVFWVDHCPASARITCEVCEISAVAQFVGTEPEDYDALRKELIDRYTDHCGTAADIMLIEYVMSA